MKILTVAFMLLFNDIYRSTYRQMKADSDDS